MNQKIFLLNRCIWTFLEHQIQSSFIWTVVWLDSWRIVGIQFSEWTEILSTKHGQTLCASSFFKMWKPTYRQAQSISHTSTTVIYQSLVGNCIFLTLALYVHTHASDLCWFIFSLLKDLNSKIEISFSEMSKCSLLNGIRCILLNTQINLKTKEFNHSMNKWTFTIE